MNGLNHETNVVAASDPTSTSVKFDLETIFEPVVLFYLLDKNNVAVHFEINGYFVFIITN